MRRMFFALVALVVLVASCGGGSELTQEQIDWCTENTDIVDGVSSDLDLLDLVDAYYDAEGDGIGSDGDPVQTDRNIEVSEDLRARSDVDADKLFDDLFGRYLEHPDGQAACVAAYEDRT